MVAKLVALVVPLGLDTFAVAAALGAVGVAAERRWRITALFTAFEGGMPLLGLALGAPLGTAIGGAADDLAIAVLLAFGLYTLLAADGDEEVCLRRLGQLSGAGAVLVAVSVSLDELAVGLTLGLLRLPAGLVIALIAAQALLVTQLGLRLGTRLKEAVREMAERLAGLALTGLGLVLLAEKLLA